MVNSPICPPPQPTLSEYLTSFRWPACLCETWQRKVVPQKSVVQAPKKKPRKAGADPADMMMVALSGKVRLVQKSKPRLTLAVKV